MMKRFGLISLAFFLGLSVNAHASMNSGSSAGILAPDRVGHVDWGIGIAGAFNDGADDSSFISTQIAYGVTPYVALGVEAGWQEADGNASDETVGWVPILVDIIVRVPTIHESLVPYGILWLGAAGVYVADSDGSGPNNNGDDSDDTGLAWKLGAGLDYFINSNWIFNFEFAFWDADVNLPRTTLGNNAGFWTVGVSLKYLF